MDKKTAPKEDELAPRTLPDLPFDEESVQEGNERAKVASNPDFTALQAELAEIKADLKRQQDANLALMAMPVTQVAPQAPKPVSYEGLPDPTMDPEGYGNELARRLETSQSEKQSYNNTLAQTEAQKEARYKAVWDDFTIQYADYAEDQDQVEFAVNKVLKRTMAKGIDTDRYIFGHTDTFMEDVVKEIDKLRGVQAEEAHEEVPKPKLRHANRTGGMLGGKESGGKPAADTTPVHSDMFAEIRKFQRTSGFY